MTHSAPRRYCLYPSNLLWHWCDLDRLRSCDKRDLGPEIQAPNSQDLWFQQVELPPCPILDSSAQFLQLAREDVAISIIVIDHKNRSLRFGHRPDLSPPID